LAIENCCRTTIFSIRGEWNEAKRQPESDDRLGWSLKKDDDSFLKMIIDSEVRGGVVGTPLIM